VAAAERGNGEVKGIAPKLAVLLIGTNNAGARQEDPKDTALGIKTIISELRTRLPKTRVLLLAIFPRGVDKDDELRKLNMATNKIIAKYADDKNVFFLDINSKFMGPDGQLLKGIMPDKLHPNAKGYLIESKLGADVALLQSGAEWTVQPSLLSNIQAGWTFEEHLTGDGADMAVVVSLAQDAREAAVHFIDGHLSTVRLVLCATIQGGPNSQSLQNATEAFSLAGALITEARNQKIANGLNGRCHFFVAAPNSFSFYLGQVSRALGAINLHEYNFEQPDSCEYWASLFLDPSVCV